MYERVEPASVQGQIDELRGQEVAVDPEAGVEEEEAEEEDDPNDDRPAWQKRIDAADGIKRTKNGTPIINYGPPTA